MQAKKFLKKYLSSRAADMPPKHDLEAKGPVRVSEVEVAAKEITGWPEPPC